MPSSVGTATTTPTPVGSGDGSSSSSGGGTLRRRSTRAAAAAAAGGRSSRARRAAAAAAAAAGGEFESAAARRGAAQDATSGSGSAASASASVAAAAASNDSGGAGAGAGGGSDEASTATSSSSTLPQESKLPPNVLRFRTPTSSRPPPPVVRTAAAAVVRSRSGGGVGVDDAVATRATTSKGLAFIGDGGGDGAARSTGAASAAAAASASLAAEIRRSGRRVVHENENDGAATRRRTAAARVGTGDGAAAARPTSASAAAAADTGAAAGASLQRQEDDRKPAATWSSFGTSTASSSKVQECPSSSSSSASSSSSSSSSQETSCSAEWLYDLLSARVPPTPHLDTLDLCLLVLSACQSSRREGQGQGQAQGQAHGQSSGHNGEEERKAEEERTVQSFLFDVLGEDERSLEVMAEIVPRYDAVRRVVTEGALRDVAKRRRRGDASSSGDAAPAGAGAAAASGAAGGVTTRRQHRDMLRMEEASSTMLAGGGGGGGQKDDCSDEIDNEKDCNDDGKDEDEDDVFPPTVFTDAVYTRGILLRREMMTMTTVRGGGCSGSSDYSSDCRMSSSAQSGDDGAGDGASTNARAAAAAAVAVAPNPGGRMDDEIDDSGTDGRDNARSDDDDDSNGAYTTVELSYDYFGPEPDDADRFIPRLRAAPPYNYGPCQSAAARAREHEEQEEETVTDTGPNRTRYLPTLSPEESRMWMHKHAATTAAARRFPMEAVRLLGTITLHFDERVSTTGEGRVAAMAMTMKRTKLEEKIEKEIARAKKASKAKASKAKTKASNAKKGDINDVGDDDDNNDENCFEELNQIGLLEQCRRYNQRYRRRFQSYHGTFRREAGSDRTRYYTSVTPRQALADALAEAGIDCPDGDINGGIDSLPPTVRDQVQRRSEDMIRTWKELKSGPPRHECWDVEYGGFREDALKGGTGDSNGGAGASRERERYVPLAPLARWATNASIYPPALDGAPLKDNKATPTHVTDRAKGRTASLYGGLRHIPTDAESILRSLLDLSHPNSLYRMPLITPYAVAQIVDEHNADANADGGVRRTWRVRIGIYANRLLPEVLSCHHLHVVMSALDAGSYLVSRPLHLPPMRDATDPVFESSPYPVVRIDDDDVNGDRHWEEAGSDSDEDKEDGEGTTYMDVDEEEEEKKEGELQTTDAAMIGTTRDESWISPFTPKGLLKLLENKGNDTSAWPHIANVLGPFMQLDLMLHQQHAVCWMLQMESLGAFGINSIIWEEREFLDGGKYYYSPALGQIRLCKPPVMNGGILADEMGLGKTIEVLGLIASTLDDLKREAEAGGPGCTHATLIIVPPALASQWLKEIEKTTGDKLRVEFLDARTDEIGDIVQRTSADGRVPDIVLTTYGSLERPKTSRYLANVRFGRIVLDEMQEIRSSTTKIAKNCERLQCQRRWMLSGTPLFDGVEDLRGELNFLKLSPYAAKLEDGFFDFSIMNHWKQHSKHGLEILRVLGLLMLRRSKDMTVCRTGLPLMDQKKLTIEYVPIQQQPSERALYCWMEYIVSLTLKQNEEARDTTSRNLCLRLLREICLSVVLLNGGLGCSSQLSTINQLMIKVNRRMMSEQLSTERLAAEGNNGSRRKRNESTRVVSCDEALRFLTQHQSAVNVREDFVSDLAFGGGRGVTNRSHAVDSVEDQVAAARRDVDSALLEQADARRKRAKAHWHLALELVTTGALWKDHATLAISPKFSTLWKWRFLCTNVDSQRTQRSRNFPTLLARGWRPALSFLRRDLWAAHPEFSWAHPLALTLDNIPQQVTLEEVKAGILEAARRTPQAKKLFQTVATKVRQAGNASEELRSQMAEAEENLRNAEAHDDLLKEPKVIRIDCISPALHWKAFLQFSDEEDQRFVMRKASSSAGIALKSKEIVPYIQESIEKARENLSQAESENKVYPCRTHAKREADAKKALQQANLGLRIVFEERSPSSSAQSVLLSRSVDPFRNMLPRNTTTLLESAGRSIVQTSETLTMVEGRIAAGQDKITRLMPALNQASEEVKQMSAFETLEALNENELEKTKCPICLSPFGTANGTGESPVVAMINCGHFFCIKCLDHYTHQQMAGGRNVACPNCRKPFSATSDVIHVDHLLKESETLAKERGEAKRKVREASRIVDESNGVIDGSMWHTLFLSFDLPAVISRRAHFLYTAMPRDVLAHIRAATGMEIDSARADPIRNDAREAGRSSKVRALLRDLPLGEHSVVFTGSREAVMHLSAVLKREFIGCHALYTGQNPLHSSEAVTKWENGDCRDKSKSGPVLIVQAGAAASGLTLTVASKMFLMEPFARQEEEHQAYARCHRYGQKNNVHVKIYYAPVSVESRLLEWRKKAAKDIPASSGGGASYVFSEIYDDSDADEDEESNGEGSEDQHKGNGSADSSEDTRRSMFLLGLIDERGNPLHVEDDVDN